MANYTKEQFEAQKTELMEKCFDCFAERGLHGTGMRALGEYCGCNHAKFYTYFKDLDDIIIQSTEHCMSKVEDDFMERSPKNAAEVEKFIDEIPYWTAEKHGKKYRLMYQVYTHPKYREYGQKFFEGVTVRYTQYAKLLENKINIPSDILTGMIFVFVRACVHYALFEDEYYLKEQMKFLKQSVGLFYKQFSSGGN